MTGRYKVERSITRTAWIIRDPDGAYVADSYHFDTAVWLASNFAGRAEVRRMMREGARHATQT